MRKLPYFAGVAVVSASALAGWGVWNQHEAGCASTNRALGVLAQVLKTAHDGPHHFNDPIDVSQRDRVYHTQTEAIKEARCR